MSRTSKYIFTFHNFDEYDSFIEIVNKINSGLIINDYIFERTINSIDYLLYDGLSNLYICVFSTNGQILNGSILFKTFNIQTYDSYDKIYGINNALFKYVDNKGKTIKFNLKTNEYLLFKNDNDMFKHISLMRHVSALF